jgi:hypothetical protein
MEILLIVSNLDDEGNIKRFLHVFAEDKGQHMAKMQGLRGGSSTGVKVKWRNSWVPKLNRNLLVILTCCQNGVQISVWKEYSSSEEIVGRAFCNFFNSIDKFFSEMIASKLLDEFIIVNLLICRTWDGVWVNYKIFSFLLCLFHSFFFFFNFGLLFRFCLFHQL